MGNAHTIFNKTPYTWYYRTKFRDDSDNRLPGHSSGEYLNALIPFDEVVLKYGNHSDWDLKCAGGGASYDLRETDDRQKFELVNNLSGIIVDSCPNFARLEEEQREKERREKEEEERKKRQEEERRRREEEEKRRKEEEERRRRREEEERRRRREEEERRWREEEERRRRREEEERRRQAQLERERRIQQQINEENQASRHNLTQAYLDLQEEQNLTTRRFHQEQTMVLHQLVEDHTAEIHRDESADVAEKFEELLDKYQITEAENEESDLEDRIKTLQNELTQKYFQEHQIPVWSLLALDQATGYIDLSLTERLSILEAVVKVTMERSDSFEDVQDKKLDFLLSLQEQLHVENPTLAQQVLRNVLNVTPQLPSAAKEILSHILFNKIWTSKEIKLFIGRALSHNQKTVTEILHRVCTYSLNCIMALTALNERHPLDYIQDCVSHELDKDIDTVLNEMQDKNYPDDLLWLLGDVLRYIEKELQIQQSVDINTAMIRECKRKIMSLDLSAPDIDVLKRVLVVLSIAVKTCTTETSWMGGRVEGYFPRLSQLAALLLLLLPQLEERRGCLLEIGTGEGKTCILAMFATIQATRGAKVDILTSSPLLAIRDQEEWSKLFDMFGVTSSIVPPLNIYNCSAERQEELIKDAYSKQVVYGNVGTFAADALRQEFEKKTTRGSRKFDCVIVDEVDYMTLDSGVQVTFLSHQASGLRHVEQVLASIWALMSACRPIELFETGEIWWGTRIQLFHKIALQAVIGSESEDFSASDILVMGVEKKFYSQRDLDAFNEAESQTDTDGCEETKREAIEKIMANVGPEEQYQLLSELKMMTGNSVNADYYILENNLARLYGEESHEDSNVSILLLQKGQACEIMSEDLLIEVTVDKLKSRIKYSHDCDLDSLEESKGFIVIPSFLKKYIENQLPVFAENALKAIRMTRGREYMIDKAPEADRVDSNDADSHKYDAVIPVDFQASGVLEKNRRWGDGLQQFLEMKHQLAISSLSNVTNYMSNVHFFKRYLRGKGIFGVSGTLGGEAEKTFLERHYKTACYVIPSHRQKKLVELPAVQVSGERWIQVICESAWRAADRGQVVLIICEDVKTADKLKATMHGKRTNNITMYTISEKHNIEKQNFGPGNIIIATNLGGRGTDIHVQHQVNECGGLFVLLTYFPGSQRVERQVFGRTARKGNPGMVQMILNRDRLAAVYQAQSAETMRQLREEHEVSRLASMERDELFEIDLKETLFSRFCEFLADFDKNFTHDERRDLTQIKVKDIPKCFKSHCSKFDYQTALNALKESWALWLIFHEGHISRHEDIAMLSKNLIRHLEETANDVLHGRSNNFYDYIRQAKSRTDLYCIDKHQCDYGAITYWKSAAKRDPFYSAVALYNQAYITMNLTKKDYKAEAKRLLEEVKTAVDVFLSESTNTMMFCNLSVTSDFEPHHKNSNLQAQMTARMNIFKAWKGYIENAVAVLKKLESDKTEAVVEETSVYNLSKNKDPITTHELLVLYEYGLGIVFEVKKKPEFSYDALACFLLGVFQVAAGVLVCALSGGIASQFGLGLISEGVSDMIQGIKGMIQGTFDWAEWAIAKAISIGVSLVFGGLSRLRNAASVVRSGAKGLMAGAKCSSFTVKQCLKHAGKYAVQELGKQGCMTAVGYAIDKGLNAVFQKALHDHFKKKTTSLIKANRSLDNALNDLVCSGVPKTAMKNGMTDYRIVEDCEESMHQSVNMLTSSVIPDLMMDCTTVTKALNTLSEVCGTVTQHIHSEKASGRMQYVMKGLEIAKYVTMSVQILQSYPTEKVINDSFVPKFLESMKPLTQEKYDHDGRHKLPNVKRLKEELFEAIAESVSREFISACSRHMTALMNKACMAKVTLVAGSAVSNLIGRTNTQSFFTNQVYKHDVRQTFQSRCQYLPEEERRDLQCYIDDICDVNHPATAVDIHVLTQSEALQGKGIKLIVVGKDGKKLSQDYYPGTDQSAGDVILQLRKEPENSQRSEGFFSEMTKRIRGEQSPSTGHFEIVRPDGSVEPVYSEGHNCLYHAVAQATSTNPNTREEAAILRHQVRQMLLLDVDRYAPVLKLQRGYESSYTSSGKYLIIGGCRKTRKESKDRYKEHLNTTPQDDLTENDASVIKTYKLGMVGTYNDIKDLRKENGSANVRRDNNNNSSPVNADHIPPINTFKRASQMLQDLDPSARQELQQKNPKLYQMMDGKGTHGLCREVLTPHHQLALTTGNGDDAHLIRQTLAEKFVQGDVVKGMKMSLMASNPEISQRLIRDAGLPPRGRRRDVISKEATRHYHHIGDKLLVEKYSEMGVIDRQGKERLNSWLNEGKLFSTNTPEYHELLNNLRELKRSRENRRD
ncbi:uncharacterized protein LOC111575722 isoform X2 [Amphiprion ocellaris]|uniref:uncharacterized protein LOC111575722 isoform X2 n=1 Tax=Amphiprion ocellaris TaxID=80972 RepID=UPI00241123FD|nr:uncharacterized protein LOC111575722 isoform X2 [Amphiprion ocellaris]